MLASLFLALAACGGGDGGAAKPDGGSNPDPTDSGVDAGVLTCGDRELQAPEVCDDGNTVNGDGCNSSCSAVESGWSCDTVGRPCVRIAGCGNGRVEAPEACDDRNSTSNDGCSATCTVESGWNCPRSGGRCQAAACGDRIIAGDEECEDGNAAAGDGCSALCRLESGWKCPTVGQACARTRCGDGIPEGTEQCDDGNNDMGDGCSPLCVKEPSCRNGVCQAVCGDGVMLPNSTAEECDDGNTRANDGCSPTCILEEGYACQVIKDAPPAQVSIPVVYRDFRGYDLAASGGLPRGHIDFQNKNAGAETGIVAATLGSDGKPVYGKDGVSSANTHGKAEFDQWYRDVNNVNKTVVSTLDLVRQANGSYLFDSQSFFPLDNAGWVALGNEITRNDLSNVKRNFSFTSEARYWFEYKGTEVLTFRGDDDVWVFINGRRALDLGGVHGPLEGTITLSSQAGALGLTVGGIYEVVVLQAERHTAGSSYRLTLNNFETQRTVCTASCGNGTVDPGEECDDIANDGGYGQCGRGCVNGPRCGDGIQQPEGGEECDDGNTNDRDGCYNTCKLRIG